jgi:hypothetical protein
MEWRSKIGTFCGDFEFKWRRFGGGGRNRRSFFSFYFFCSLLFWRCMVERDEQSEREKQQHREKEEGASLLCGRKRD